ncbi:MAG: glycosyltransferase family 39 protein [Anaerolineae bacterium]|nr:glycosyltransferase family 39 protein [Anaerolineae bacterium]
MLKQGSLTKQAKPQTRPVASIRPGDLSITQAALVGLGLFLIALLLRLPYLGDFMTIDEIKWVEGTGQFLLALHSGNLADTYWHFHPGITITWIEAIILWFAYLAAGSADLPTFVTEQMADISALIGLMRLSPVIITALGVGGLYWLARPLLGEWPAILAAGLLAADPFFTAHSRIVNGDAATAIFMMLALLAFARLWQKHRWSMVIVAGVMAGLAILTKIPGPIILPWLFLMAVVGVLHDKQWRFWLIAIAITGAVALLTFTILWPALWVAPIETLQRTFNDSFNVGEIGEGHETFFLGHISNDPGWRFYPYALAFRLTPLTVIGLAAGLIWLWRGRRRSSPITVSLVITLLIYIVYVLFVANISPKKLDRYGMAVIPAVMLVAGLGWVWLLAKIGPYIKHHALAHILSLPLLIVLLIFIQAILAMTHYPYLLTYYNPLLGGFARAANHVPVGWGEGMEQAAAWINAQPEASALTVSTWYSDMVKPYLHTQTTSFSSDGQGQLQANYVIFYINQEQRQKPSLPVVNYFRRQEPVFQVRYQDVPYVWVYPAPVMQTKASGNQKIEGRAELLGYSWDPLPPLQAGTDAHLTLFMLPLGQLPDNETFAITLEKEGALWGEWQPASALQWQTDTLVEWQGTLHLPPATPPGNYRLVVRLMDTNIDTEVTRFPLEDTTVVTP